MSDLISDILSLTSDMESFVPVGDSLTNFLTTISNDELNETDLSIVNAAGSTPSYEAFWKRYLYPDNKD